MPTDTAYYELFFQLSSTALNASGTIEIANVSVMNVKASAYVSIWYDQSGNTNNATQTTATLQPQIVNAGVINSFQSKPSITFDGADDYMNCPIINSSTNSAEYFTITYAYRSTAIRNNIPFSSSSYNGAVDHLGGNIGNGVYSGFYATTRPLLYASISNNLTVQYSLRNDGNNLTLRWLGIDQTPQSITFANPTNSYIGRSISTAVLPFEGKISEIILFNKILSNTQRQSIERNQSKFYKITVY